MSLERNPRSFHLGSLSTTLLFILLAPLHSLQFLGTLAASRSYNIELSIARPESTVCHSPENEREREREFGGGEVGEEGEMGDK